MCSCNHCVSCIDIQLMYAKHLFLLNFNCWFVFWWRKMNNCAHLARRNYTQWKLHFQYCVLYIFIKRLPRNFYSVFWNSKIISPCNFILIGSQNAKKIGKLTFETSLVEWWFTLPSYFWPCLPLERAGWCEKILHFDLSSAFWCNADVFIDFRGSKCNITYFRLVIIKKT